MFYEPRKDFMATACLNFGARAVNYLKSEKGPRCASVIIGNLMYPQHKCIWLRLHWTSDKLFDTFLTRNTHQLRRAGSSIHFLLHNKLKLRNLHDARGILEFPPEFLRFPLDIISRQLLFGKILPIEECRRMGRINRRWEIRVYFLPC